MNKIREFTEGFFKNLNCDVSSRGNILAVKNVPAGFEKFYGKKGPYYFVFDEKDVNDEVILISEGSFLIKAMSDYLGESGKTTLLKLDFDVGNEIVNKRFAMKNFELNGVKKRHRYEFFTRYSFQTVFQYLNEKETMINEIYTNEGNVLKGDLSDYPVVEGRKQDVNITEANKDYDIAKAKMREFLKEKVEEISKKLNDKLEKELERVTQHYDNQLKEIDEKIVKNKEKIKEYEKQLEKAEGEKEEKLRTRIENLLKQINDLENSNEKERLENERAFFIKDEEKKHSLNINNKVMNVSVIYYPIFIFSMNLKKNGTMRTIDVEYDPLKKEMGFLKCEKCEKPIVSIYLCSTGHVVCDSCLEVCGECGKEFCMDCLKRNCKSCGKKLCRDCSIRCVSCGTYRCKSHVQKDALTGEVCCMDCLRRCPECGDYTDPKYFKKSEKGFEVCQKCHAKEFHKNAIKRVFER